MTQQPRAERFSRKRSARCASAWAAALLTSIVSAACGGVRPPPFLDRNHHVPPGSLAALSLGGKTAARCAGSHHEQLLSPHFKVAPPPYLQFDLRKAVELDPTGGIGHPIVHYFACSGHALEIVVVLSDPPSHKLERVAELWQAAGVFDVLSPSPGDRISLWTIAEQLRISPHEPFSYGTKMEMSEHESLQLRFDSKGSDARLMLVYRVSL